MSMLRCKLMVKPYSLIIARTISVTSQPIRVKKGNHVKPYEQIPGPLSLPILGHVHHFLPGGSLHDRNKMFDVLYRDHGPIVRIQAFSQPRVVILFDPESIGEIYQKENVLPNRDGFVIVDHYRLNYKTPKTQMDTKYKGLSTDNGKEWRELRSFVNPILLKPSVVQNYFNWADEVSKDFIKRLKLIRYKNNMVPMIDHEFKLWALESNGAVVFGTRMDCLCCSKNLNNYENAKKIFKYLREITSITTSIDNRIPFIWNYLSTKKLQRTMFIVKDFESIVEYYFDLVKKEYDERGDRSIKRKSVVEHLIDIDGDMARIVIVELFAGGLDMMSSAVMAALYLLALNPEKQQALRVSLAMNESKRYLKACIKESMRMIPIVTKNIRLTSRDYDILGYRIPKNTSVVLYHGQLCKSDSQFHRAKEYIPERWLVAKDDPLYYGNAHPFAFTPFGYGVRSCIGRRLTELQIETLLAQLIENFHVGWDGPPPKLHHAFINFFDASHFVLNDVK